MTLSPRRLRIAVAILLLWIAPRTTAAKLPPARGAIATLGDRTVEAADIKAAAAALAGDPLRTKNPALWRKALLDRCVDRELLALEAVRQGYDRDPAVSRRVEEREYVTLHRETQHRVLIPRSEATQEELDSLSASGIYRSVDLDYILVPPPLQEEAKHMVERLRAGARFDSTARIWSRHPSRDAGGHCGWVLVRDLNPRSYATMLSAKVGDVLGPFTGPYGVEIYGVAGFREITRGELFRFIKNERTLGLPQSYKEELLRKYHFQADSSEARKLLAAAALEPMESIVASLGPAGSRPREGSWRAIGVLAHADGDSVTFADLAASEMATRDKGGKLHLRDTAQVAQWCAAVLLPRLAVRDAKDRGLARDPAVVRALRLLRDEEATHAMVARESGGPPEPSVLRAYFASHAARYVRPRATRAHVACFDTLEIAVGALRAWNGVGIRDSALAALGITFQPRATATTLLPRHSAEITMLETDGDPLALSVRSLDKGQLTPAVRTVQGYAVAEILGREASRPLSFEEAATRVTADYEDERETLWVGRTLVKLRATTKIDVVPSRLMAVRLEAVGTKKGMH